MFEDSTFESNGRIRTRSRRWMIATFLLNGLVLLAILLIPLIDPEALPRGSMIRLLEAPAPPPEAPKPPVRLVRPIVIWEMGSGPLASPILPPRGFSGKASEPGPPSVDFSAMNQASGIPGGAESVFHGHSAVTVVTQETKGPTTVSSGVMNGQLIYKVKPQYPPMAIAMRLEGTVVLQAVISKSGAIENLRVVSGPAMLQQAALDSVKQWRYRPYELNRLPVEVETTINVVFTLSR
jgi:periplasmic protein TonB